MRAFFLRDVRASLSTLCVYEFTWKRKKPTKNKHFALPKQLVILNNKITRFTKWPPWHQLINISHILLCFACTWYSYLVFSPSHVNPSPVNPFLHQQLYDPSVLLHVAFTWQSSIPCVHSSTSVKKILFRPNILEKCILVKVRHLSFSCKFMLQV